MFTSTSEVFTPRRVVDEIRVDAAARRARIRRARAARSRDCRLRRRPWRAARAPLMRTASLARSPTSVLDSSVAFTYVPMPPFHSRSTGMRRMARMISFGVAVAASRPEHATARPARARSDFDGARVHAAAARDLLAVVVVPRGARQLEEPLALAKLGARRQAPGRERCADG